MKKWWETYKNIRQQLLSKVISRTVRSTFTVHVFAYQKMNKGIYVRSLHEMHNSSQSWRKIYYSGAGICQREARKSSHLHSFNVVCLGRRRKPANLFYIHILCQKIKPLPAQRQLLLLLPKCWILKHKKVPAARVHSRFGSTRDPRGQPLRHMEQLFISDILWFACRNWS